MNPVGSTPYAAPIRRRRRVRWVALALLLIPALEISVLVAVGHLIGVWPTLLILLLETLIGVWVVRREGARAWRSLREAIASGRMPSRELADGTLVLVGGALLLLPGLITDVIGLFFLLPFTRPLARRGLEAALAARLVGARVSPGTNTRPGSGQVIEGEIIDE